jgi:3-hydroxyacyl-CoA dehydrogenase
MFENIGILGSGTIGSSWAAFYALKGMDVTIYDIEEKQREFGISKARECLEGLVELGLADSQSVAAASKRLHVASNLAAMADGRDFVQESVIERLDVKHNVYAELEPLLSPDAVIASSSSGICMSDLQEVLKIPQRSLIAHPFNPPHLVPLVELVAGKDTSPDVVDRAFKFFESLGKTPVVLKKEVPGHLANRLQAALWREALDLVAQGVASVEDVDKALSAGPGLRWAIMGSHKTFHLGGGQGGMPYFMDHIAPAIEQWLTDMATWSKIPVEAKERVVSELQESVGDQLMPELEQWRDKKLTELLKVLYPTKTGV